ncbi:MAG: hypothetical protein GY930_06480 [bacterium]|nr:hypothetical protein [bacterium]
MKRIILLSSLLLFGAPREDQPKEIPADQLGNSFELTGRLGKPLGDVVTVSGILTEGMGPKGGQDGGPRLMVQRIQGKQTQEWIVLDLRPIEMVYWDDSAGLDLLGDGELEYGKTCELVGFETGRFVGLPNYPPGTEPMRDQGMGFHFSLRFEVHRAKFIDPIVYSPEMFTETPAILQGTARTRDGHSVMEGKGWSVIVKRDNVWAGHVDGRAIETQGTYESVSDVRSRDAKRFKLTGVWRLKNLADQVGKKVSLRGQLVVLDGKAALLYRGSILNVEAAGIPSEDPYQDELTPFLVEGNLARVPSADTAAQETRAAGVSENGFIVTGATWQRLPELLFPDEPFVCLAAQRHL